MRHRHATHSYRPLHNHPSYPRLFTASLFFNACERKSKGSEHEVHRAGGRKALASETSQMKNGEAVDIFDEKSGFTRRLPPVIALLLTVLLFD